MGTKDGGKKPNPNDLNSFKGFFYYMIMILGHHGPVEWTRIPVRTEKPGKGSRLQRISGYGRQ